MTHPQPPTRSDLNTPNPENTQSSDFMALFKAHRKREEYLLAYAKAKGWVINQYEYDLLNANISSILKFFCFLNVVKKDRHETLKLIEKWRIEHPVVVRCVLLRRRYRVFATPELNRELRIKLTSGTPLI